VATWALVRLQARTGCGVTKYGLVRSCTWIERRVLPKKDD
jgi:hypothetical protein